MALADLLLPGGFTNVPEGDRVKSCYIAIGMMDEATKKVAWLFGNTDTLSISQAVNTDIIESIFCKTIDNSTYGAQTISMSWPLVGGGPIVEEGTESAYQAHVLSSMIEKRIYRGIMVWGLFVNGVPGSYTAMIYDDSTIIVNSVDLANQKAAMAITVTFGGVRTAGTVDKKPPESNTATATVILPIGGTSGYAYTAE